MTHEQVGSHLREAQFNAPRESAAAKPEYGMPLTGLMARPFPTPGPTIRAAMEQLQRAATVPPATQSELQALAKMPRPWDPANCTGQMRSDLWVWLDLVAMWVNEQHLWNVTRPGVPECWPDHPHVVHDLAVLACSRYFTTFSASPGPMADWHTYDLPSFLERLRDRLGDACQPGRHQLRPRLERDASYASERKRQDRSQRHDDDARRAADVVTFARHGNEGGHVPRGLW